MNKFTSIISTTRMGIFQLNRKKGAFRISYLRDLDHFLINNSTFRGCYIVFCDAHHLLNIEEGVIFYRCERRVNNYSKLRSDAENTEKERIL